MSNTIYKSILILQLIKALAINCLILNYSGLRFNKPFLIIVGKDQSAHVSEYLSIPTAKKIAEYNAPNSNKSQIVWSRTSPILFKFHNTDRCQDYLELILRIAQGQTLDGSDTNCVYFIITEETPLNLDYEDFFIIELLDDLSSLPEDDNLLIPDSTKVPIIIDKIKSIESHGIEKVLLATLECIRGNLDQDDFNLFSEVVSLMTKEDHQNKDLTNISDSFISGLYRWHMHTKAENAYELPDLPLKAINHFEEIIAYNDQYAYIKDSFFKKICEFIFGEASYTLIKNTLTKEEVIISDNCDKKTYTCNMNYVTPEGEAQRTRMIRLDKKRLKKAGEASFIFLCTATNEDNI